MNQSQYDKARDLFRNIVVGHGHQYHDLIQASSFVFREYFPHDLASSLIDLQGHIRNYEWTETKEQQAAAHKKTVAAEQQAKKFLKELDNN